MRAPALVGIVTALHILAISAFVMIQGCGTTRTARVTPGTTAPPPPTLPPRSVPSQVQPTPSPTPVMATTAPAMATSGVIHTIVKGETLSHVAKTYGISTRELAEHNSLSDPNKVRIGQKIRIPASAGVTAPSAPAAVATAPATAVPSGAGSVYVVQAGDNLTKIARKYGTTIRALQEENQLSSDRIVIGQKLTIPGTGAAPAEMVSVAEEVTVLDMDTGDVQIPDIAVPADTTRKVTVPATESIDDIPAPETGGALPSQDAPIDYTVVSGDNLDDIAKLFIVSKEKIMALNGLGPNDTLTPGQRIKIPPSEL